MIDEGYVYDRSIRRKIPIDGLGRGAISVEEWRALARGLVEAKMATPLDPNNGKRGQPSSVIEVGTLHGKTTHGIMRLISRLHWEGVEVYTIDKEEGCASVVDSAPKSKVCPVRIQFHHGTSKSFFGQYIFNSFLFPVRFAFIDGCHCEDCVREDIESIVPHTAVGSVLAFHDAANQRELGMLVHERYHGDGKDRFYGVREAIRSASESTMSDFERLEVVDPVKRPSGAPTPIMGGLEVWQRK